ncbi:MULTISPECIES: hypothetical protein [unclassified Streptomyces]|nr:hypothetical protein [Streptomyces sp. PsTaAH-130]
MNRRHTRRPAPPAPAPTFAAALAERLTAAGHSVSVRHRDLDKDVVQR